MQFLATKVLDRKNRLAPVTKHTVDDDELEGPRCRHLSLFRRGEALKAANGMFGNELSSSTAIATTPAEE